MQEIMGKRSTSVTNWVERGAVRKFAEAIGDPNPLYLDEGAAESGPYGRLIAPPTFPMTFDFGQLEGLKMPDSGLIHGSQSFTYERPLYVGEEVACYTMLENTFERSGSLGKMTFVVLANVGEDGDGRQIFKSNTTLIVTGAAAERS